MIAAVRPRLDQYVQCTAVRASRAQARPFCKDVLVGKAGQHPFRRRLSPVTATRVTSFRQKIVAWNKLRRYMEFKGPEVSFTDIFDRLLEPLTRAVDGGPDPFPELGRPLPAVATEPPAHGTA